MKKEFDIPREILSQFQRYSCGHYRGFWKIVDTQTNVCDQEESVKHWNNNQMVITLHSNYWNDENSIPKGKRIINKVKKYLEEKLLKKGKN